jgi:site-specific DNA recombinase
VHVVTHDLDTRQDNAGILGAVNGAMSEQYRQEIARRTRRGLEGRARARQPTGGRAYGYIAARESSNGERAIHDEQAAIVRRIFRMYAHGAAPRAIAATLNEERVPSPGSGWNRITRRRAGWVQSAIAGDARRAVGILNNELYIGRVVWNRFRWVRSASDSSRRRAVLNPSSEWIVHTDERLRIVPQELWDRVKARQRVRSEDVGESVRRALNAAAAKRKGRKPKFLFSGLLNCGICGARLVMADRTHYACSSRVNGGAAACASDVRIRRQIIESGLLAGIKNDLLAPDVMAEVRRQVQQIVRENARTLPDEGNRLQVVEREVANLTDAIASGTLRASAAIAERLARAEGELARLHAAPQPRRPPNVERLLPQVTERYRALVERLETSLIETDMDMARADLRTLFGSIRVMSDEREVRFEADLRGTQAALLRAVGASANNVVAGACFGLIQ